MDGLFLLNILTRWVHVTAAVIAVGGTVLLRFVLLPVLAARPDGAEILDSVRIIWKRIFHTAMGILLLSGFYNYLGVAAPKVRALREAGNETIARYHSVMGVKIILSLVVFGIAIALLKPVPAMHENRKTWLTVNTVLALLILLFGAYLRRLWP
jgi:uncharacterized membrane protein